MKPLLRVLFLLTVFSVLSSGAVMAQAPVPPVLFQGDVTIDDVKAPVGTIVVAEMEGEEVAMCTVDGEVIEEGRYMLAVPNNGSTGKMVIFKVNGIVAAEREYVSSMDESNPAPVVELDLDVETSSSGTTVNTGDSTSGLSAIAITGIVVGIIAAAVIVVLLVRRRRQR